MMTDYGSPRFRRGRGAYVAQCTLEYFISILSTDVFLSKLLKSIGCSDAFTGVLSSVISFAFLFQLLTVPLAARLTRVKKTVTALDAASQLLFTSIYAVPFLPIGASGKAAAAAAALLLGYFTLYLNNSFAYRWGNAFVAPENRARFSAGKEMVSLFTGIFFTLGAGFASDALEEKGNGGQFLFLGGVMAVAALLNLFCFTRMEDLPIRDTEEKQNVREILRRVFGSRGFRAAAFLTALTEFARYTVVGFLGTYKTEQLGLSLSRVQMINVLASMGRFAVSRPFGVYSDKNGYARGYFYGNLLTAASFLCGIFTAPGTKWLIIPATVLFHMSYAGTNQNTFQMLYAFVDNDAVAPALALAGSIRGVSGFCASLFGSALLKTAERRANTLFGRTVYGQQLQHAAAFLFILAALAYNRLVVCRLKEEKK